MSRAIPVAFYAPLKSPNHPTPSGDRQFAQLFLQALALAGFAPRVVSDLRTFDGAGDRLHQERIDQLAVTERRRLSEQYINDNWRPKLWFSYHLYHKAPDLLGPVLSKEWDIPYVVAEASYAPKQQQGPWVDGLKQVEIALKQAAEVISINPVDQPQINQLRALAGCAPARYLRPFIDPTPFKTIAPARTRLAQRHQLPIAEPWLLTVAMLRPGAKLSSFTLLTKALANLSRSSWQWIIIGSGEAQDQLDRLCEPIAEHTTALGRLPQTEVWQWMKSCDVLVWPALNEALGMVFMEAQACQLPVIVGHNPGVASICAPDAQLVNPVTEQAFTQALAAWLDNPVGVKEGTLPRDVAQAAQQLNHWLMALL